MNDLKKSALWALSITPITLLFDISFAPMDIVGLQLESLQGDLPEWVYSFPSLITIVILVQYASCFLPIYLLTKIVRVLKSIRAGKSAEEKIKME